MLYSLTFLEAPESDRIKTCSERTIIVEACETPVGYFMDYGDVQISAQHNYITCLKTPTTRIHLVNGNYEMFGVDKEGDIKMYVSGAEDNDVISVVNYYNSRRITTRSEVYESSRAGIKPVQLEKFYKTVTNYMVENVPLCGPDGVMYMDPFIFDGELMKKDDNIIPRGFKVWRNKPSIISVEQSSKRLADPPARLVFDINYEAQRMEDIESRLIVHGVDNLHEIEEQHYSGIYKRI